MGNTATTPSRRGPLRRAIDAVLGITLGRLLKWALLLGLVAFAFAIAGFAIFVLYPSNAVPAYEPIDEWVYIDQGWGTDPESPLRQTYYFTAQGTSLPQGELVRPLRYAWFVHLEQPFSTTRFADPEHMSRYRFLLDAKPSAANPDHLPVGFTRHYDGALGQDVLDITCAACHSGQLHYTKDGRRLAIRVDGGQAMHAFTDMQRGAFGPTLVAALIATYFHPAKFARFAKAVIGPRYPAGKDTLRDELWATIVAFATQGQNDPFRHLYPVQEGFGRTDALGRIANTVFGDHLIPDNYQTGSAPVSYPYVWNIWKFDWVQYTGSVKQPLARNVGEALGVGAVIRMTDAYGNPIPPAERYRSSVNIPNLVTIERTLQHLTPPRWPEDVFGPVDAALAERGRALFATHCQGCHGPHPASRALQLRNAPGKPSPDVEWQIEVIPVDRIGTDPTAATAFVERRYDLRPTGLTRAEVDAALRPELTRALARDVRYRLTEVIDGRTQAGLPLGGLPALLAGYPDPDAPPEPASPAAAFAAIAAELTALGVDRDAQSTAPYGCDLTCQTTALAHDVDGGVAAIDATLASLDLARLTEGEGLNVLGLMIKAKYFADHDVSYAERQCLEGFGTLDLPQQVAGYKPRPLEGVWATPPFLHNGSVPNVHELLLPSEQRTRRFFVGRRDYDPVRLGYAHEPDADGDADGFWLDTTLAGNRNTGHAFAAAAADWQAHREDPRAHPLPPGVIGPLLADDERRALLEYLKVHRDLPATPPDFVPPDCAPEVSE